MKDTAGAASARGGYRFLPSSNPVDAKAANEMAKKIPNALNPELRELKNYGEQFIDRGLIPGDPPASPGILLPHPTSTDSIETLADLIPRNVRPENVPPTQPLFSGMNMDGVGFSGRRRYPYGDQFHPDIGPSMIRTMNQRGLKAPGLLDMGEYVIDQDLVKLLNDTFRANTAPY